MRRSTLAMLGVLLAVTNCGYGFAEESPSWWWPFGKWDEPTPGETAPAAIAAPRTVEPDASKPWWPTTPKFAWPDFSGPSSPQAAPSARRTRSATYGKPAAMRKRNAWAQPNANRGEPESPVSSPWETVTNGAHQLGESTRNAWHKSVDALVPGESADAVAAQREPRSSWWSRMWGAEERKPEGPRTVTEWMAQDRLDP